MYDKELVRETIQLLEKTLEILLKRVSGITSVHDFLDTENGVILLDSVCMKLIAVGESVKSLDKITDKLKYFLGLFRRRSLFIFVISKNQ